jgi:hypothetical protein
VLQHDDPSLENPPLTRVQVTGLAGSSASGSVGATGFARAASTVVGGGIPQPYQQAQPSYGYGQGGSGVVGGGAFATNSTPGAGTPMMGVQPAPAYGAQTPAQHQHHQQYHQQPRAQQQQQQPYHQPPVPQQQYQQQTSQHAPPPAYQSPASYAAPSASRIPTTTSTSTSGAASIPNAARNPADTLTPLGSFLLTITPEFAKHLHLFNNTNIPLSTCPSELTGLESGLPGDRTLFNLFLDVQGLPEFPAALAAEGVKQAKVRIDADGGQAVPFNGMIGKSKLEQAKARRWVERRMQAAVAAQAAGQQGPPPPPPRL